MGPRSSARSATGPGRCRRSRSNRRPERRPRLAPQPGSTAPSSGSVPVPSPRGQTTAAPAASWVEPVPLRVGHAVAGMGHAPSQATKRAARIIPVSPYHPRCGSMPPTRRRGVGCQDPGVNAPCAVGRDGWAAGHRPRCRPAPSLLAPG
jgi:hypothetical protein